MPDIKDSVGEGGANQAADVALIQAMLKVIKNAKGVAYLSNNYDGIYGNATKSAIVAFQTDLGLAPKAAAPKGPVILGEIPNFAKPGVAIAKAATDKPGLVAKNSATLKKLVAALPAQYQGMRILPGTKTVYLEAGAASAASAQQAVGAVPELDAGFRANVAAVVKQMHTDHKIALRLTSTGGRRSFADQAAQTKTMSGPGESDHNYGRAVDLGFRDFQWVDGNGAIRKDADWLNALEQAKAADSTRLWDIRDGYAGTAGIYPLKFERVHLQAWKHGTASMGRSLAALLSAVGKTKWTVTLGQPNQYKSDLGYGGTMFPVGTAKQIWAGSATITKAMIVQIRNDATKAALAKKGPDAVKSFVAIKEVDIKTAEVTAMQAALAADFQAADKNWKSWKPVP